MKIRFVAGCFLMFGLLAGRLDAQEKFRFPIGESSKTLELRAAVGGGEDGVL